MDVFMQENNRRSHQVDGVFLRCPFSSELRSARLAFPATILLKPLPTRRFHFLLLFFPRRKPQFCLPWPPSSRSRRCLLCLVARPRLRPVLRSLFLFFLPGVPSSARGAPSALDRPLRFFPPSSRPRRSPTSSRPAVSCAPLAHHQTSPRLPLFLKKSKKKSSSPFFFLPSSRPTVSYHFITFAVHHVGI
jgi:hypothetical protein